MTWLQEEKKKKAAYEKLKKEAEENRRDGSKKRHDSALEQMKKFVAMIFDGVKKDKTGKKLNIQYNDNFCSATVSTGGEKLVEFHYHYEEETEGDGDGCGIPTGIYELKRQMILNRPHAAYYGGDSKGGKTYEWLNENALSNYLLQFLE